MESKLVSVFNVTGLNVLQPSNLIIAISFIGNASSVILNVTDALGCIGGTEYPE